MKKSFLICLASLSAIISSSVHANLTTIPLWKGSETTVDSETTYTDGEARVIITGWANDFGAAGEKIQIWQQVSGDGQGIVRNEQGIAALAAAFSANDSDNGDSQNQQNSGNGGSETQGSTDNHNPQDIPATEPKASEEQKTPAAESQSNEQQQTPETESQSSEQQQAPETETQSSEQQQTPETESKSSEQQQTPVAESQSKEQQQTPETESQSSEQQQQQQPAESETSQDEQQSPENTSLNSDEEQLFVFSEDETIVEMFENEEVLNDIEMPENAYEQQESSQQNESQEEQNSQETEEHEIFELVETFTQNNNDENGQNDQGINENDMELSGMAVTAVPAPASLFLFAAGLLALRLARRG